MSLVAFSAIFLLAVIVPASAEAGPVKDQYTEAPPSPTGNDDPPANIGGSGGGNNDNGGNEGGTPPGDSATSSNSPGQSSGLSHTSSGDDGSSSPGGSGGDNPVSRTSGGSSSSSGNTSNSAGANGANTPENRSGSASPITPDGDEIARVGEPEPAIISSTEEDGGSSPMAWILIGVAALGAISAIAAWKFRRGTRSAQ